MKKGRRSGQGYKAHGWAFLSVKTLALGAVGWCARAMFWKTYLLIVALLFTGCAPSPYPSLAVISVSPDHVTVRYTEIPAYDQMADVSAMADAQCAVVGRSAMFQWDIELVSVGHSLAGSEQPALGAGNIRLRKRGFHQAHFLCVEP